MKKLRTIVRINDINGTNMTNNEAALIRLNPKNGLKGYKLFVGFRKDDRKDDLVKTYSEHKISELRKIYDILSVHGLCPKVCDIFSFNEKF